MKPTLITLLLMMLMLPLGQQGKVSEVAGQELFLPKALACHEGLHNVSKVREHDGEWYWLVTGEDVSQHSSLLKVDQATMQVQQIYDGDTVPALEGKSIVDFYVDILGNIWLAFYASGQGQVGVCRLDANGMSDGVYYLAGDGQVVLTERGAVVLENRFDYLQDQRIGLWDGKAWQTLAVLSAAEGHWLAMASDGKQVWTLDDRGEIALWQGEVPQSVAKLSAWIEQDIQRIHSTDMVHCAGRLWLTVCVTGSEPIPRVGLINVTDDQCYVSGKTEGRILRYDEHGDGTVSFLLETYGLEVPHRPPSANEAVLLRLSADNKVVAQEKRALGHNPGALAYYAQDGCKWWFNLHDAQTLLIKENADGVMYRYSLNAL